MKKLLLVTCGALVMAVLSGCSTTSPTSESSYSTTFERPILRDEIKEGRFGNVDAVKI